MVKGTTLPQGPQPDTIAPAQPYLPPIYPPGLYAPAAPAPVKFDPGYINSLTEEQGGRINPFKNMETQPEEWVFSAFQSTLPLKSSA